MLSVFLSAARQLRQQRSGTTQLLLPASSLLWTQLQQQQQWQAPTLQQQLVLLTPHLQQTAAFAAAPSILSLSSMRPAKDVSPLVVKYPFPIDYYTGGAGIFILLLESCYCALWSASLQDIVQGHVQAGAAALRVLLK
jgi:hypothetical protein